MRTVIESQRSIGQIEIGKVVIDVTSRDDIPLILLGLQQIYADKALRDKVFKILEEIVPVKEDDEGNVSPVSSERGRPGMHQWSILVLGCLRLCLNTDYDRVVELANEHKTLRELLGHSGLESDYRYHLQTVKDNLRLFTAEILDRINAEIIRAGYQLLGQDIDARMVARCDSFVVETDVHFPTDFNLLTDAIRVVVRECVQLCEVHSLPGWRQHGYNLRKLKKAYRKLQKMKHSTSKDAARKAAKASEIEGVCREYLDQAQKLLKRALNTLASLKNDCHLPDTLLDKLKTFCAHAERQIDQITRRVLQGEKIPHEEKVFSLFEAHTEWINKGKAGVPVELGVRVCILEDRSGFILHSQVMEKTTDDQVAVAMIQAAKEKFPSLSSVSFDKGFHSPSNQEELKKLLACVVLPKKGKCSKDQLERECAPEFKRARREHSAVESAINALEVHGLDVCPDHGIDGFKRYVGLAVVSRNIQQLGAIIRSQERESLAEALKKAA
ncbi:MAG: ISNCY family transposase [Methylococcales bacterium]